MILPKEIDPVKAAKAAQVFEGDLPFTQLTRMQDLVQAEAPVHYRWSFALGEREKVEALLQLQCHFVMACQRCGQPVPIALDETISMQLVHTEQEAEHLSLALQPILTDASGLCHPYEIIEDELILALPMLATHNEKDCPFFKNEAYYAAEDKHSTYKPFANLVKVFESKE